MESQGRLKLEVQNIRNNKGLIQVLLFSHKQGFPDTPSEALKKITIPINNHRAEYTWMKIDYGIYALAVIHDENTNEELDRNWVGYPQEGFGVSNNPTIHWQKPKFEEAVFSLNKQDLTISIMMNYLP